eukprot:6189063-Pleurochrysis_carterae.AAC.2
MGSRYYAAVQNGVAVDDIALARGLHPPRKHSARVGAHSTSCRRARAHAHTNARARAPPSARAVCAIRLEPVYQRPSSLCSRRRYPLR